MSLAAIIPVGNLSLHGYQHTARLCIASACAVADRVYLVSSTREEYSTSGVILDNANLSVISDERTWFARTRDGSEWFDAYRVMENVNIGLDEARLLGFEQAVCLMCNWYVPESAGAALRRPVYSWGWLYRRDYLAGQMFHCMRRLPFVVRCDARVRFTVDAIEYEGTLVPWGNGAFEEHDANAVLDLQHEQTPDELAALRAFIRNYRDLKPKNAMEFRLSDWVADHAARFYGVHKSDDKPPFALDSSGFVSEMILEAIQEETNG